ncbi:MAG: hypothetical protein IJR11_03905 [Synergistaceae bacterium]|nr:hypothetical protein [Synergistaceae bacterium]
MKRIFVALMILVLTGSACFGAVSEDMSVYVRKDVFDAKMEALFNRLHGEIQALSERMDGNFARLSEKIDGVDAKLSAQMERLDAKLSERIDGNFATLSGRIDGLDARMSDLRNGLYLGLVLFGTVIALFGVVIGLPFFNKWREERKKEKEEQRRPSITLDDVRKLIEENNAKLLKTLQA